MLLKVVLKQKEPEMKLVDEKNFTSILHKSWNMNYSEWPNKSFCLPSIFFRKFKENLATNQCKKEDKLVRQQREEDVKAEIFRMFEMNRFPELNNVITFLIYGLHISEDMACHLSMITQKEFANQVDADFIIFTSNCQVILLAVASKLNSITIGNLEACRAFLIALIPESHFQVHPLIFCNETNTSEDIQLERNIPVQVVGNYTDLTSKINSILTSNPDESLEKFTSLIQLVAFIRRLKYINDRDTEALWEVPFFIPEMMGKIQKDVAEAKIQTKHPVTMKTAKALLEIKKSRLYGVRTIYQPDGIPTGRYTNRTIYQPDDIPTHGSSRRYTNSMDFHIDLI